MKSILLSTVAILAVSTAVKAADLGAYEPAPSRPFYDWTGFYLGISAGWMGAKAKHTAEITDLEVTPPPVDPLLFGIGDTENLTNKPDGGLFGGYAGYNWHTEMGLVLGIEGDIYGANAKESIRRNVDIPDGRVYSDDASIYIRDKVKSTWSVRARLGWAIENFMPYIAGGYAGASMKTTINTVVPDNLSAAPLDAPEDYVNPPLSDVSTGSTNTYSGWTIGAGAEWMLTPNWLVRGDYQYKDLGNAKTTGSASDSFIYVDPPDGEVEVPPIEVNTSWRNRTKLNSHQFTVGTSFKF